MSSFLQKEKAQKQHQPTCQLLKCDSDFLYNDVNERIISHRLTNYLELYFPWWNVDCENNKNHDDPKRLYIQRRFVTSIDTQTTIEYTDIIVHKGETTSNLFVIEMKKSSSNKAMTIIWES